MKSRRVEWDSIHFCVDGYKRLCLFNRFIHDLCLDKHLDLERWRDFLEGHDGVELVLNTLGMTEYKMRNLRVVLSRVLAGNAFEFGHIEKLEYLGSLLSFLFLSQKSIVENRRLLSDTLFSILQHVSGIFADGTGTDKVKSFLFREVHTVLMHVVSRHIETLLDTGHTESVSAEFVLLILEQVRNVEECGVLVKENSLVRHLLLGEFHHFVSGAFADAIDEEKFHSITRVFVPLARVVKRGGRINSLYVGKFGVFSPVVLTKKEFLELDVRFYLDSEIDITRIRGILRSDSVFSRFVMSSLAGAAELDYRHFGPDDSCDFDLFPTFARTAAFLRRYVERVEWGGFPEGILGRGSDAGLNVRDFHRPWIHIKSYLTLELYAKYPTKSRKVVDEVLNILFVRDRFLWQENRQDVLLCEKGLSVLLKRGQNISPRTLINKVYAMISPSEVSDTRRYFTVKVMNLAVMRSIDVQYRVNPGYFLAQKSDLFRKMFRFGVQCALDPSEMFEADMFSSALHFLDKLTRNRNVLVFTDPEVHLDDFLRLIALHIGKEPLVFSLLRNALDNVLADTFFESDTFFCESITGLLFSVEDGPKRQVMNLLRENLDLRWPDPPAHAKRLQILFRDQSFLGLLSKRLQVDSGVSQRYGDLGVIGPDVWMDFFGLVSGSFVGLSERNIRAFFKRHRGAFKAVLEYIINDCYREGTQMEIFSAVMKSINNHSGDIVLNPLVLRLVLENPRTPQMFRSNIAALIESDLDYSSRAKIQKTLLRITKEQKSREYPTLRNVLVTWARPREILYLAKELYRRDYAAPLLLDIVRDSVRPERNQRYDELRLCGRHSGLHLPRIESEQFYVHVKFRPRALRCGLLELENDEFLFQVSIDGWKLCVNMRRKTEPPGGEVWNVLQEKTSIDVKKTTSLTVKFGYTYARLKRFVKLKVDRREASFDVPRTGAFTQNRLRGLDGHLYRVAVVTKESYTFSDWDSGRSPAVPDEDVLLWLDARDMDPEDRSLFVDGSLVRRYKHLPKKNVLVSCSLLEHVIQVISRAGEVRKEHVSLILFLVWVEVSSGVSPHDADTHFLVFERLLLEGLGDEFVDVFDREHVMEALEYWRSDGGALLTTFFERVLRSRRLWANTSARTFILNVVASSLAAGHQEFNDPSFILDMHVYLYGRDADHFQWMQRVLDRCIETRPLTYFEYLLGRVTTGSVSGDYRWILVSKIREHQQGTRDNWRLKPSKRNLQNMSRFLEMLRGESDVLRTLVGTRVVCAFAAGVGREGYSKKFEHLLEGHCLSSVASAGGGASYGRGDGGGGHNGRGDGRDTHDGRDNGRDARNGQPTERDAHDGQPTERDAHDGQPTTEEAGGSRVQRVERLLELLIFDMAFRDGRLVSARILDSLLFYAQPFGDTVAAARALLGKNLDALSRYSPYRDGGLSRVFDKGLKVQLTEHYFERSQRVDDFRGLFSLLIRDGGCNFLGDVGLTADVFEENRGLYLGKFFELCTIAYSECLYGRDDWDVRKYPGFVRFLLTNMSIVSRAKRVPKGLSVSAFGVFVYILGRFRDTMELDAMVYRWLGRVYKKFRRQKLRSSGLESNLLYLCENADDEGGEEWDTNEREQLAKEMRGLAGIVGKEKGHRLLTISLGQTFSRVNRLIRPKRRLCHLDERFDIHGEHSWVEVGTLSAPSSHEEPGGSVPAWISEKVFRKYLSGVALEMTIDEGGRYVRKLTRVENADGVRTFAYPRLAKYDYERIVADMASDRFEENEERRLLVHKYQDLSSAETDGVNAIIVTDSKARGAKFHVDSRHIFFRVRRGWSLKIPLEGVSHCIQLDRDNPNVLELFYRDERKFLSTGGSDRVFYDSNYFLSHDVRKDEKDSEPAAFFHRSLVVEFLFGSDRESLLSFVPLRELDSDAIKTDLWDTVSSARAHSRLRLGVALNRSYGLDYHRFMNQGNPVLPKAMFGINGGTEDIGRATQLLYLLSNLEPYFPQILAFESYYDPGRFEKGVGRLKRYKFFPPEFYCLPDLYVNNVVAGNGYDLSGTRYRNESVLTILLRSQLESRLDLAWGSVFQRLAGEKEHRSAPEDVLWSSELQTKGESTSAYDMKLDLGDVVVMKVLRDVDRNKPGTNTTVHVPVFLMVTDGGGFFVQDTLDPRPEAWFEVDPREYRLGTTILHHPYIVLVERNAPALCVLQPEYNGRPPIADVERHKLALDLCGFSTIKKVALRGKFLGVVFGQFGNILGLYFDFPGLLSGRSGPHRPDRCLRVRDSISLFKMGIESNLLVVGSKKGVIRVYALCDLRLLSKFSVSGYGRLLRVKVLETLPPTISIIAVLCTRAVLLYNKSGGLIDKIESKNGAEYRGMNIHTRYGRLLFTLVSEESVMTTEFRWDGGEWEDNKEPSEKRIDAKNRDFEIFKYKNRDYIIVGKTRIISIERN